MYGTFCLFPAFQIYENAVHENVFIDGKPWLEDDDGEETTGKRLVSVRKIFLLNLYVSQGRC